MNLPAVRWLLGCLVLLLAGIQLVPACVSAYYGEPLVFRGFMLSAVIAGVLGAGLVLVNRRALRGGNGRPAFFRREGLAVVGLAWLLASAVGALPFLLCGTTSSIVDALFESASGFTTTGASILTPSEIDGLPFGIAFWRCLTHWVGGIGIVVVFVTIFPAGGRSLFRPEGNREVDAARVRDSAFALLGVYVTLTVLHALALWLAGLSSFDAVLHSFSSMGTGGFSNRGASIGYYRSPLVEVICIIFMIAAGTNFVIWGAVWRRGPIRSLTQAWASTELRLYLLLLGGGSILLSFVLWFWGGSNGAAGSELPDYSRFLSCLRDATFSLVSIQTSTGFATTDFDRWPDVCRFLLMVGAFIGACAGSTGGGIKVFRLAIAVRASLSAVKSFARPRAIVQVAMDGRPLEGEAVASTTTYLALWILAALLGSFALSLFGVDLPTAITGVLCCLNNVGPGLAGVGPAADYGYLDAASKLVLCLLMILGRLEFYALVALTFRGFWSK
ncbi:MAG: TrkH family potassium uptake protein [Planctomycetota bacterium]